ncbi:MAG: multiprotein bridging factor aMBF1 [Candidatus Heimdallarchaeaceae archaeon]
MSNLHRCEMCGREVAHLTEIEIEGARLFVCPGCSKHGKKVVKRKPSVRTRAVISQPGRKTSFPSTKTKAKKPYQPRNNQDLAFLAEDYDKRLRLARQKLKLSQKEVANKTKISATNLQSFELGKLRPTDEQIRILEKFYNIKLMEKVIDYGLGEQKSSKGYQTLGDIVVIKKKDDQ